MIAYIFYTKDTPADRDIQHFTAELERLQVQTKMIEADSREGIELGELYDVMQRPSVVLVRDDGSTVERWQGDLPLVSEVSSLAHI
jgi:hypothetical protein